MTLLIHAISFCVVEYRFRTNSSQYSNWKFSSQIFFSSKHTKKISFSKIKKTVIGDSIFTVLQKSLSVSAAIDKNKE